MNWYGNEKTTRMSPRAVPLLRRRLRSRFHQARQHRSGSVAVISAITAPLLVLALGLGIDVSYWMAAQLELQRMADVAAMAGAATYASKNTGASALITAANVAELNGFPADTRATGTNTLSESDSVWSGYFTSNTYAQSVTVSLQRQVMTFFAGALPSVTPVISAKAVAEVTPRPNSGQACVLALQGYSTGVTTSDDVTVNGNTTLNLSGCDIRADASMTFNGNPTVTVANVIASGNINGNLCGKAPFLCQQPQIPDPFAATYGPLLTTPSATGTQTSSTVIPGYTVTVLQTGVYYEQNNVTFNSNTSVTLPAGVYYLPNGVTFNGGSTVVANGVTFITGNGNIIVDGNSNVTVTAPTTGPYAGLIFATQSSLTFNGNPNVTMQGAIYAPDGQVTIDGNFTGITNPCLTIVASSVLFNGNSTLSNAGCTGLGVPGIYDEPAIARLVQ
jgi:Flp pilus assembly protein TadG